MRELELLPAWYPRMRRRKRLVTLQSWLCLVVVAGLGLWGFLAARNLRSAEATLADLRRQQSQTDIQVQALDEMLLQQAQWRQKEQIVDKLGLDVAPARLLTLLESVMPAGMSLTALTMEAEEQLKAVGNLSAAKAVQEKQTAMNRYLRVTLSGVAPTDVDLAVFVARLSSTRFLENVSMSYAKERSYNGHVLREFEVKFSLDLGARLKK